MREIVRSLYLRRFEDVEGGRDRVAYSDASVSTLAVAHRARNAATTKQHSILTVKLGREHKKMFSWQSVASSVNYCAPPLLYVFWAHLGPNSALVGRPHSDIITALEFGFGYSYKSKHCLVFAFESYCSAIMVSAGTSCLDFKLPIVKDRVVVPVK